MQRPRLLRHRRACIGVCHPLHFTSLPRRQTAGTRPPSRLSPLRFLSTLLLVALLQYHDDVDVPCRWEVEFVGNSTWKKAVRYSASGLAVFRMLDSGPVAFDLIGCHPADQLHCSTPLHMPVASILLH